MKKIVLSSCLLIGAFLVQAQTKVLSVDYSSATGTFKDLTGVNLGPNSGTGTASMCYDDIGISTVRTHDYRGPCDYQAYSKFYTMGAFNYSYQPWLGGPGNYNWITTNTQISNILAANCTPFFRLGISFPTSGTTPTTPMPKDLDGKNFKTFASICKRTAMHYTGSWDNGFSYNIPYWEVWNEPNHVLSWPIDSVHAYYRMYKEVRDSIRSFNPNLKVGGPATASNAFYPTIKAEYLNSFFHFLDSTSTGIDFYSFHSYEHTNPWNFKNIADTIRYYAGQNNVTIPEIIVSEGGIDHSNNLGYQDSPLGCSYLASVLLTADIANISKVLWYSGTSLGALCDTDTLGAARLTWNAYAYKAYNNLYHETRNKLSVSGNEYVNNNYNSTSNLLLAAGKSTLGDSVNVMISNLSSAYSQFDVSINNLPWNSTDQVSVSVIRIQNGNQYTTTTSQVQGASSLIIPIAGVTDESVYVVKLVKSSSVGLKTLGPIESVIVYPNPAKSNFTLTSIDEIERVVVYDFNGRALETIDNFESSNKCLINVEDFSNGNYLLKVITKDKVYAKMILVNHED